MRKQVPNSSITLLLLSFGAAMLNCSAEQNAGPSTVIVVPGAGSGGGGSTSAPEAAAPLEDAGSSGIDAPASNDAGAQTPTGEAGPGIARDPRCLPSGESAGDAGCSCLLTTSKELLNQCTGNQCQAYDNARIKNAAFVPRGVLPAVP